MPFFFATSVGLYGLLGVPVLIGLHFFVHRAPPLQISSLALWLGPEEMGMEGANLRSPPLTAVLLLEVLALLLLVAALCEPRWVGEQQRSLGLVIDSSASMAARVSEPSPAQYFAGEVERLRGRAGALAITVVASGVRPEQLQSEVGPATAAAALGSLAYVQGPHSLAPAYDLLRAQGIANDNILVLTDRQDTPGLPAAARVLRRSAPLSNVGWVGGGWGADAAPFAVVQNFGAEEQEVEISIRSFASDRIVGTPQTQRLTLEPGQQEIVRPLGAERAAAQPLAIDYIECALRVAAEAGNALDLDDTMILYRPTPRRLTLRSESATLEPAMRRVSAALQKAEYSSKKNADVVVVDEPPTATSAYALHFALPSKGEDTRQTRNLSMDTFSSLMSGFEMQGLVWYYTPRPTQPAGQVLLADGDRPLIWRDDQAVHFNIDIRRSNFFRHPAFPIFMLNLLTSLAKQSRGLENRSFASGADEWFAKGACRGLLEGPGDWRQEFAAAEKLVSLSDYAPPGLYSWGCGAAQEQFAIHFTSPEESDLQHRQVFGDTLDLATVTGGGAAATTVDLGRFFVALAMLTGVAAWWLLSRVRQ